MCTCFILFSRTLNLQKTLEHMAPGGKFAQPPFFWPASGRGRAKRGFHRSVTNPLHVAIVCYKCAHVATFVICGHILSTCSHESSSGGIAALL